MTDQDEVVKAYWHRQLSDRAWLALLGAAQVVLDYAFMDLAELNAENPTLTENSQVVCWLPPQFRRHYNANFMRKFIVSLSTMSYKLAQPECCGPSSTAEELALHAIIDEAESIREDEDDSGGLTQQQVLTNEKARQELDRSDAAEVTFVADDYEMFREEIFQDEDVRLLFEGKFDGIEDSKLGKALRVANLKLSEWFLPFNNAQDRTHPWFLGLDGEPHHDPADEV